MSSISNVRASTRATERAAASKQRWRTCVQNRISDFQFLRSALRFTIARSIRSTAFAIHRVARRIAPGLGSANWPLDAWHVRAGERLAGHSVDDLLAYAVATGHAPALLPRGRDRVRRSVLRSSAGRGASCGARGTRCTHRGPVRRRGERLAAGRRGARSEGGGSASCIHHYRAQRRATARASSARRRCARALGGRGRVDRAGAFVEVVARVRLSTTLTFPERWGRRHRARTPRPPIAAPRRPSSKPRSSLPRPRQLAERVDRFPRHQPAAGLEENSPCPSK